MTKSTKRPMIRIHDIETDEVIDREMNDEEYDQYLTNQANYEKEEAEKLEAETKRNALLEKLGITEDEAKLLLG